MTKKITIEIIASLLILLFIYAAVSKLTNYNLFKFQLGKSPLIGPWASVVAILIPLSELLIVLLLLIKRTFRLGLNLSLSLLFVFTTYLLYILMFSKHLPCTCGGILQQLSWKTHVVFNLCFIFLNILALRFSRRHENFTDHSKITFA